MKDSGKEIQQNGGRMMGFVYRHRCMSIGKLGSNGCKESLFWTYFGIEDACIR